MMNDESVFIRESSKKTFCYVHIDQAVVRDDSYVIHIDLGSCVSVILCGLETNRKVWFGVNHLFKSRVANKDMALEQIAGLIDDMKERGVARIGCLGLFGGSYREKSMAKETAQRNVLTVMEALSLYDFSVEVFQTGFSQGISVLKSDERDSFLIRRHKLGEIESLFIEIPIVQIFR